MQFRFNIDLEKINEANGQKAEALFKYLKNTAKNKTPLILRGTKVDGFWDCDIYECAIPASHFTSIKLPAEKDVNANGAKMYALLSEKLLGQFVPGAEYFFKETEVNIKRDSAKVRDSYKQTVDQLECQLGDFLDIINTETSNGSIKLTVDNGSELINILKEISSTPDAAIYITKDSITLRKDTIFFRTKNHEQFEIKNADMLFINMYLANKILSTLDYCAKVEAVQTNSNFVVIGYDEDGKEIVKSVSSIFEANEDDNPTDEDLAGVTPSNDDSETIDLDLQRLLEDISSHMDMVSSFVPTAAKKLEVKLHKNGDGASFGFETGIDSADKTIVVVNTGNVAEEEPTSDKFTDYTVVLPISAFKTLIKDNQNLKIVFNDSEDSAVLFESGDYKILSGKLFD